MQMFGRTVIYTDASSMTADNVREVLKKAPGTHVKNQNEIEYLYTYYKSPRTFLALFAVS